MKKTLLPLFVLYVMPLRAQVPLQTVVTHFTNTKCSICASRNPGFYKNTAAHPEVTLLSVHPSSPYAACVLSRQNTADNDALTRKWGVYGATPRLVINGEVIPAAADYSATALYAPYLGLSSPLSIRVDQRNSHDSIHVTVTIIKHASTPAEGTLFLGLAEDSVFANGGNGETEHYNVLRKSLTGAEGTAVSLSFAIGDSLVLNFSGEQASFWNSNRMFAIAMLSGKADSKLIQSATSSPLRTNAIPALSTGKSYTIGPNPATDRLMIYSSEKDPVAYRMYNMAGVMVLQGSFSGRTAIDIKGLPGGQYMLYLSAEATAPYKVLVQH